MNVLVACEESQIVMEEFRKKGHNAFSCDLQKCSGNFPEYHINSDVLQILNAPCNFKTQNGDFYFIESWDLIIAHPPCTYLSNAGARWLYKDGKLNSERYNEGLKAKEFFMKIYNADCNKICIENPLPSKCYELPEHSQTIQPYEFGDPYSKKTLLWLKGLPPLFPKYIINEHIPYITSGTYSKTKDPKYKGCTRAGGSQKNRSKTFKGIALAMAESWG